VNNKPCTSTSVSAACKVQTLSGKRANHAFLTSNYKSESKWCGNPAQCLSHGETCLRDFCEFTCATAGCGNTMHGKHVYKGYECTRHNNAAEGTCGCKMPPRGQTGWQGNPQCWDGQTYTYAKCCNPKNGVGNSACWDGGHYTYKNCLCDEKDKPAEPNSGTPAKLTVKGQRMSSQYGSSSQYGPQKAFDGNKGSMAHAAGSDRDPWIQADLGGEKTVTKIKLKNRGGSCSGRLVTSTGCGYKWDRTYSNKKTQGAVFRVSNSQCSGDTCPGTECGWIQRMSKNKYDFEVNCPGGTKGRYVSMELPGPRILNIMQMEIYGF